MRQGLQRKGSRPSVYTDFNLANPDTVNDYTITARQYSIFLRILYNATYLDEVDSEKALSLMSQSTFVDGMVAGVPSGVTVAQKYGERIDTDSSDNAAAVELHNCGIVYDQPSPFVLCVMTKAPIQTGVDVEKQSAGVIKDITRLVYNYINTEGNK